MMSSQRFKIEKITNQDYILYIWHYSGQSQPFEEEFDNHAELTERVNELKSEGYIVENDMLT